MSLSVELSRVPTALPACPGWCTLRHSTADLGRLDPTRPTWGLLHTWALGDVHLMQLVEIDVDGAPVHTETWIDVAGGQRLSPSDAGVLASDLLEATIRVYDTP
jgi:hypothetical protein